MDTIETASESQARASCVLAQTALYRHFDSAGKLLYVGIALSPTYRLRKHSRTACWFGQIAAITVQWFPSRGEALVAERDAIDSEWPLHNRTTARSPRDHANREAVGKIDAWMAKP